jgi:hypothetical protein
MSEIEDFEEEMQVSPDSLIALNQLSEKLLLLRESKDELEEQFKALESKISEVSSEILRRLKDSGKDNWQIPGALISIKNTKSIRQPENLQKKLELFGYLRGQGVFEEMVNVHARTLSSWANKEIEAKEKQGVFGWVPPGLTQPETFSSLAVKKK